MRIISGNARGTKLFTLEGQTTRPTLDRVKESVFNIIQNQIYGSVFLDLFSGSGAIGLEAASRGAKKVIMCDKSKDAINIINKNIEKTHLGEIVDLYHLDYERLLNNEIKDKIDIIYIDPPYDSDFVINAIKILKNKELINEETIVIIETDNEQRIKTQLCEENVIIDNIKKYGRVYIFFARIGKG